MSKLIFLMLCICLFQGCKDKSVVQTPSATASSQAANAIGPAVSARFSLISPDNSGVTFANNFKEDFTYNFYNYPYIYNGGGVAAGDINGDSLPDLYFTATFAPNKLYLNLGNFKFLDITDKAGVSGSEGFKTGTVMADINGDGKLDIYVCRTSKTDDHKKTNLTFINMGNKMENGVAIPYFENQSVKLGLDDNSNTNHACFFDFDRDGDLDLFLLSHKSDFSETASIRLKQGEDSSITRLITHPSPFETNKLYKNENGHFTEITRAAGLESTAFGLSVTSTDINRDGWPDLYVANDYIEPDRIYINNKNGTFTDKYVQYLKHSSQNAMGSDLADINNDGLDDIMVLDMKPEDPIRYKTLINVMQYDRYNMINQYGYGRQVGRNVLQLNNGNNTYSEIGQYAGVAATDWSWGALLADLDNDGWKDIFITNGYRRDVTNFDYLNFVFDSLKQTGGVSNTRFSDINMVLDLIPSVRISNYLYINNKHLGFINASRASGVDKPSFSNGAALADLDRDGDLDLIINNFVDPAFIYRNDISGKHWLQIDVQEPKGNTDGIGTSVDLYAGGIHQHEVMMTNKGFYSSSEPILQFGLDENTLVDSIILQWPEGAKEILISIKPDKRIVWKKGTGKPYVNHTQLKPTPLFADGTDIPNWKHQESNFVDFKREKIVPYMLSSEGPCIAIGDVNGDQLEDIYAGNGSGYAKALFIQNKNNSFSVSTNPAFIRDSIYEDCGSILADFDGDGDKDLFVISGGNAFNANDPHYMSRLYLNDGKGSFTRALDFPIIRTNAGAVLSIDYDNDQDMDLIIAGRSTPGRFPEYPRSYLLRNDKGKFVDVTHDVFPDLENLGMITDIKSGDLDGDQKDELVFVGEWLPITVFSYSQSKFKNVTANYGLEKTSGWWKSVTLADMDNDGDLDILAGNMGLNNRLSASDQYPATLISKDFDGNGSLDPILCYYFNGKLYPYAGKDALIAQIPRLKKKFVRYTPYASATIEDIFTQDELKGSTILTANTFQTMYFVNENKKFVSHPLPYQVQLSPVFDIVVDDFNGDGKKDILMAGNFLYSETETGEMDAGNGTLLIQNNDGTFQYVPNTVHGFWAQKEVRELKEIKMADGKKAILTANNKGPIEIHIMLNQDQLLKIN